MKQSQNSTQGFSCWPKNASLQTKTLRSRDKSSKLPPLKRRKAIEQGHDLENLLKTARAMETADEHTQEMEKQQLNAVNQKRHKEKVTQRKPNPKPPDTRSTKCGLCGGVYPHKDSCPAKGKTCAKCGKLNHLARVCRQGKKPNYQTTETSGKTFAPKHRARVVDIDDTNQDLQEQSFIVEEDSYTLSHTN